MNASVSFLRAKMAPAALATAIGLALAVTTPAQAQYSYPGTASSSARTAHISPKYAGTPISSPQRPGSPGHQGGCGPGANCNGMLSGGNAPDGAGPSASGMPNRASSVHPIRAGARQRAEYGTSDNGYGRGNPSMRHGEACPPGSECATPVPANGSGSGHTSGGYGAHESYGAASTQAPHQANAIHPIQAGGSASINPVRAGAERGALDYGPSANSNANFRNSVTGKSSGPNVNTTGQQTSFTGPNGKQVDLNGMSNPSITGPNGQKVGMGGPDLNHLGGGYGHQKGSGMNMGGNVSFSNGSGSMQQTGSAPGMASANGLNMNNGGAAGTSEGADGGNNKLTNYNDTHNPDGSTKSGSGSSSSGSFWSHPIDNTVGAIQSAFNGGSGSDGGNSGNSHSSTGNGSGSSGAEGMDPNKMYPVKNPNSHHVQSGGGDMPADMGATAGPGEIVSGTGQIVHPGQKKGQDTGGGQGQDSGSSNSGGRNAQGQYIAPSGQDNVKKPKEVGVLKMDYNGKNGAIDPKLNGSNGGGG